MSQGKKIVSRMIFSCRLRMSFSRPIIITTRERILHAKVFCCALASTLLLFAGCSQFAQDQRIDSLSRNGQDKAIPASRPSQATVSDQKAALESKQDTQKNVGTSTKKTASAAVKVSDAQDDWRRTPWFMSAIPPTQKPKIGEYRWRNAGVEKALQLEPDQQPKWHTFLDESDKIVALNAAIALVRSGDINRFRVQHAQEILVRSIRDTQLPTGRDLKQLTSMRCAAAEAIAYLPDTIARESLQALIAEFGQFNGKSQINYVPEIHADLLRALMLATNGKDQESFIAALQSPMAEVRRVAVQGLGRESDELLSNAVIDLWYDKDPTVRQAVLQTIVSRRDNRAIELLQNGLGDHQMQVQLTAIHELGNWGDEAAHEMLLSLKSERGELTRAAVVEALTTIGDHAAVISFASDKSNRVRVAVVQGLSKHPDRKLAEQFLRDPSSEVRKKMIEVLGNWSLEQACPCLFIALESETPLVRQAAARQLREHWPAAADLSTVVSEENFTKQIHSLRERYAQQFGPEGLVAMNATDKKDFSGRNSSPEQQRIEKLTQQTSYNASLDGLEKDARRIVKEKEAREADCPHWRGCVTRLLNAGSAERRAAVQQFTKTFKEGEKIGIGIAKEMARILERENEEQVWFAVMQLVKTHSDAAAAPIITLAASHTSAEIRRQALEWIASYPDKIYTELLYNTLIDDHVAVVQAALKAIAALPELPTTKPLEELLAARDPAIRLAAAYALAAHGNAAGALAIGRLAYHDDPSIRRQAAQAMGLLDDEQFVTDLLRLLDDRPEIQLAALTALRTIKKFDAAEVKHFQKQAGITQPDKSTKTAGSFQPKLTCSDQGLCWKAWAVWDKTERMAEKKGQKETATQ